MRTIYTETALRDLAKIYEYQALNWPSVTARFNIRLRAIERYISDFPRAAPKLPGAQEAETTYLFQAKLKQIPLVPMTCANFTGKH